MEDLRRQRQVFKGLEEELDSFLSTEQLLVQMYLFGTPRLNSYVYNKIQYLFHMPLDL